MDRSTSTPGSMTRWADALRSPDLALRDEAARRIWERYSASLLALVRRHLDQKFQRREDEHDILQSMYKSFCLGQQKRPEPLDDRDHLWCLMVHITMCKVANTVKKHQAARRDIRREQAPTFLESGDSTAFPEWVLEQMDRNEPGPLEAMILEEELQAWLTLLPEDLRQIALWKLEGFTNKDIGEKIQRTERSVELKLQIARQILNQRLATAEGCSNSP